MPQATVNPSGAAALFDPSTAIAHFQFIEDASAFIQGKHAAGAARDAVAAGPRARAGVRIYERVAENWRSSGTQRSAARTSARTRRAAPSTSPPRAAAANGTDVATVLTHRFRLPASLAADGGGRVARAAGAVRLPRSGRAVERRDVAEHPRGVGDGPPPLPEAGALSRATKLTEATLEPLLASSHAVGRCVAEEPARERAGLPHAAPPRARRRVPDGRGESLDPLAANSAEALWKALPRCAPPLPNASPASRTPRSTPRSPPSSRSGCSSTPTRRCPSPRHDALALLRRRRHGSAAAAGADELPG